MSDTFNPGPGWREVGVDEANAQESIRHATRHSMRYWVREAPLPTEQFTVIRVGDSTWILEGHLWWEPGFKRGQTQDEMVAGIGGQGFTVVAEPRAVTARTLLDRTRELASTGTWHESLITVVREFGVDA